ncbi:hypothetical protein [Marinococcus luteus]|uniref:hypothetical protein n=1 Tax=Marinococcus luteus TaxID=1122204 RepID=UPI002ACC9866|nr:hypothetical protein [Marinococcus luteus]MDZ5784468.1 hypothetical protein [Marinococcus luteus]
MASLVEFEENKISVLRTLSQEEEETILGYIEDVNFIDQIRGFYQHLTVAYNDYLNWKSERDRFKKERYVINYISAVSEFVEKWEKYSKRKSERNENNKLAEHWKERITNLYDNSFEYRFLYNLRNYTQHGGSAITGTNSSVSGDYLYMKREMFLNDFKVQKVLREDLEAMEDKNIVVNTAIDKVHKELEEFQNAMATKDLEEEDNSGDSQKILLSSIWVLEFYNNNQIGYGKLMLDLNDSQEKVNQGEESFQFQFREIPYEYAKGLVRSAYIDFYLKGNEFFNSSNIPYEDNGKIYQGAKVFKANGVEWEKIKEIVNIENNKYCALYVPIVLNKDDKEDLNYQFSNSMERFIQDKS